MKKITKLEFKKLIKKISKRPPTEMNYAFSFQPEEIGLEVKPTTEQIEKWGFQKALERLDRKSFNTTCMVQIPIDTPGQVPSKEVLEMHREKARQYLYNRITTGETNEAIQSGVRTIQL